MTDANKKELYFGTVSADGKRVLFANTPEVAAALRNQGTGFKTLNAGVITFDVKALPERIETLKGRPDLAQYVASLEQGVKAAEVYNKTINGATPSYGHRSVQGRVGEITRDKRAFTTAY